MTLDFDGKSVVEHLNKKLIEINPDITLKDRKNFIVEEMVFHKLMTKKQVKEFVRDLK